MINQQNKTSYLLIHGFTSHRTSLTAVIPELDKRNIEWHYPILAGHGTRPEDLIDKTWEHWQQDVDIGLKYLLQESNQVIIIALSMGALLALELAATYQKKVSALVLLSPALHFQMKLTRFTSLLSKVIKRFPNPSVTKFSSAKYIKNDLGYRWVPTQAFHSYWLRTKHFDSVLDKIHQPTRIIHSKNDKMAAPSGAQHVYDTIKSKNKELIWLEKSGHEVLLDAETELVLKYIFNPLT